MSQEEAFQMLQFVALTLPSIALLMSVLTSIHAQAEGSPRAHVTGTNAHLQGDFAWLRFGLILFLTEGLVLIIYLIVSLPALLWVTRGLMAGGLAAIAIGVWLMGGHRLEEFIK